MRCYLGLLYSTLLKKQKYEISQLSLLQVVMSFGLIFLIPIYFIEYQLGFRITLEKPFFLILSYVVLLPGLASFILWIKGILYYWSKSIWCFFTLNAYNECNNGNDNF